MVRACITVDVEHDCPPYLRGWRGLERGLPLLLELLDIEGVRGTFFTTGETALHYPDRVRAIAAAGHEIACHGHTHRSFRDLSRTEAAEELDRAKDALAAYAPLTSFRAPYLRLPGEYLELLEERGFQIDSSVGRYKADWFRPHPPTRLLRIPASITAAALRLPAILRDTYLRALRSPVVLFVHPWEFVDMSAERIPWECRVRTGAPALVALAGAIRALKARGALFSRMDALLETESPV